MSPRFLMAPLLFALALAQAGQVPVAAASLTGAGISQQRLPSGPPLVERLLGAREGGQLRAGPAWPFGAVVDTSTLHVYSRSTARAEVTSAPLPVVPLPAWSIRGPPRRS